MMRLDNQIAGLKNQLPKGFVYLADIDSTIQQDVRYAGYNNFVGRPIRGYESACIILTLAAAQKLAEVQASLQAQSNHQYTLQVYDGYRPQQAALDFWNWAQDTTDVKMQAIFYPQFPDKTKLFQAGYIAKDILVEVR